MGFPLALIWKQLTSALGLSDILFGLTKAVVFGTVVAGLGCYHGVHTRQGPSAVGDSATRAVVSGILLIIIIDAVFSVFAYVPRHMSPAAPPPIIEVKHLTMGYDERIIQEDLNFQVNRGEVFVILGGSGSGKSSLLKCMIGLLPPVKGEILFDGVDIVTAQGEDRLNLLKKFGVMYQSGALFGSMTLVENARLPLDEFTRLTLGRAGAGRAHQAQPSRAARGCAPDAGRAIGRNAEARRVSPGPWLWTLPSSFSTSPRPAWTPSPRPGLDRTIRSLSRDFGITFVVVTHELQSIFAIADRCIMVDAQRKTIIAEGKPAELRDHSKDPVVRQFFRREADVKEEGRKTG